MQIELVAEGLAFPEGPIALDDGTIMLVEIRGQRLTAISPEGKRRTIAEIPGGPNGAALGPDGAVYVCNNGGRFDFVEHEGRLHPAREPSPHYSGGSIQRVDLSSGRLTTLYTQFQGKPLLAPNDLVFDGQGGFWFTDNGMIRGNTLEFGAVYYAAADGSSLTRARKNILAPNGIGLSPAEDILYVADTMTGRLHACAVAAPGKLASSSVVPGPVVVTLPGYQGFDSLAVEAAGKICVATLYNGGISIIDPNGSVDHVPFPDDITTNICFGGAEMRDAWITCSGRGELYKCRWPRPGLRLNFAI